MKILHPFKYPGLRESDDFRIDEKILHQLPVNASLLAEIAKVARLVARYRKYYMNYLQRFIAAAVSEPEANERGSSLISRRLHHRGLQPLFLTKRKELWLCRNGRFRMRSGMCKELWLSANGRFRMRIGMPQGIVFISEWDDLGCAAYQSHV